MEINTSSSASGALEYIVGLNEHLSSLHESKIQAHIHLSAESLVLLASEVCDYIDRNNLPIPVPAEMLAVYAVDAGVDGGNELSSVHPSCFRSLALINEALNFRYKGIPLHSFLLYMI